VLEQVNLLVQRLATRRSLLVLLIAYCIYFPIFFFANVPFGITAIQPYASQGGILDVEFFYTSAQAYERLTSFGEQGRAIYLHILMGDLIYPALLGCLLAISIARIVRRLNPSHNYWQYLALLPLVNMAFDYCEDCALISMLVAYPNPLPILGTFAGIFTLTKNIFGILSFATFLLGLLALVIHRVRASHA
jgi:hypothetical protein